MIKQSTGFYNDLENTNELDEDICGELDQFNNIYNFETHSKGHIG